MRKYILIALFAACVLNVWAKAKSNADEIQQLRNEVYKKMNSGQITTGKAYLSYKGLQKKLLAEKDYDNYIDLYLFAAVDIYVTTDDYQGAAKVMLEALDDLKYFRG